MRRTMSRRRESRASSSFFSDFYPEGGRGRRLHSIPGDREKKRRENERVPWPTSLAWSTRRLRNSIEQEWMLRTTSRGVRTTGYSDVFEPKPNLTFFFFVRCRLRESAKKKLRARSSLFFSFERKKRRTKTNTKRIFFCETRHKSERCDETSTETMINADGDNVDLYIPRKCSWTNRLITCKDHAAIQVNVGHLGPDGTYTGNYSTFAISGYVRNKVRCREVQLRMQ